MNQSLFSSTILGIRGRFDVDQRTFATGTAAFRQELIPLHTHAHTRSALNGVGSPSCPPRSILSAL